VPNTNDSQLESLIAAALATPDGLWRIVLAIAKPANLNASPAERNALVAQFLPQFENLLASPLAKSAGPAVRARLVADAVRGAGEGVEESVMGELSR
jgi:hypothetical protein